MEMKKIKMTLAMTAMVAGIAFVGCKDNKKVEETPTTEQTEQTEQEAMEAEHTSQNSLDWAGTYAGVTPCADCPGIETTIVLNDDNTFKATYVYQEKKEGTFEETGSFSWDDKGSVITLKDAKGEVLSVFKVQEGSLKQLSQDGTEVEGELAAHYVLTKK